MSSSFPAARFPVLPLGKKTEATESVAQGQVAKPGEPTDEILIGRVCGEDDEALGLLFKRYARLVWSIAERILGDSAEAEDVTQEIFLSVYQKASSFDSSKGAPRTLIVHMAYQRALTRRTYLNARHSRYLDAQENTSEAVAPTASFYDESIEAHFGKEGLEKAVADMTEAQRETLRLFFFEGYTLDEIALRLGQSRGNVKHHYYRGLDRLRRHLPAKDSGK